MKNGLLLVPGILCFAHGILILFWSLIQIWPQWSAFLFCLPLVVGAVFWIKREFCQKDSLPLFSCLIPLFLWIPPLVYGQTNKIAEHRNRAASQAANVAYTTKIHNDFQTRRASLRQFTKEIQNSDLNLGEKASFLRDLHQKERELKKEQKLHLERAARIHPTDQKF